MGRKATGTVRVLIGEDGKPAWHGKWTRANGSRSKWLPLPGNIPLDDRTAAEAKAASMAPKVKAASEGGGDGLGPETVEAFSKRWIKHRTEIGIASVKENERRLRLHILPELGPLDVTNVTRDHLEALVEKLDARKTGDGDYDWRYAVHIWGDVRKMFTDAARKRGLRVRDDNPAANVEPPRRGVTKAKQYLHPSEGLALLRCDRVPRLWKRLWAVSTYQYLRPEEVEPLEWKDLDLEHGVMHIHRAVDRVRDKGKLQATKTKHARRVPSEPSLLPLLESMHAEAKGKGRVFPVMPAPSALARRLRRFLKLAGVERDIFTTDKTRRAIDWYGATRGTGITWCAVRGDEPLKIQHRAGHERFDTTLIYLHPRGGEPLGGLRSPLPAPSGGPSGNRPEIAPGNS